LISSLEKFEHLQIDASLSVVETQKFSASHNLDAPLIRTASHFFYGNLTEVASLAKVGTLYKPASQEVGEALDFFAAKGRFGTLKNNASHSAGGALTVSASHFFSGNQVCGASQGFGETLNINASPDLDAFLRRTASHRYSGNLIYSASLAGYENFKEDLEKLAGMWTMERDLLHTQIYPLRMSDYLTRKLKVSGVLEKIIAENNLQLKYRDSRDVKF